MSDITMQRMADLAPMIEKQEVSPVEVVDACLIPNRN